jgi:hypothetical protein
MHRSSLVLTAGLLLVAGVSTLDARRWGADGHTMAARGAVALLPDDMPAFFTDAGEQLVWLDPEPDRWRSRQMPTMDGGFSYDHYIDLENMPTGAWDASDRWGFVRTLYNHNLQTTGELGRPERDVGLLPYRIEELYQRLLSGFRRWRDADGEERRWIEERIVNDAGILGHYVTDAAQPHHTTIHFNGWNASSAQQRPNPEDFTEARDFHGRFESDFVRSHLDDDAVRAAASRRPVREIGGLREVRRAIRAHILESHAEVVTLYRLEKDAAFDPEAPAPATHLAFTAARLGAGAAMLRDLWVTAWRQSTEWRAPR